MAVRILHTADWQLGKLFGFVHDDDARAFLRAQRFETIDTLGALATSRGVDAVLVAGDVFEMNEVEDVTIRRMADALARHLVPWLLLPGNHDYAASEGVWTRLRRHGLPAHVTLLTTPTAHPIAGGRATVLAAPLQRRHEATDITAAFNRAESAPDQIRIGLAHGCVQNRLPGRSEAHNAISDTRAESARLDYLALGDWHGTFRVSPRCYYSGTPEPDRFRNNDAGNALVVSIDGPGATPTVEAVPVAHYRWTEIDRELFERSQLHALSATFDELLAPFDRHVVSLRVSGLLDLAARQAFDEVVAQWRARFRYLAEDSRALRAMPADDDLAQLRENVLLRTTVDELLQLQTNESHPDHPYALLALQRLYEKYVRVRS